MSVEAVYTVELEAGELRAVYVVTAAGRNGAVVRALARAFKAHPLVADWRPVSVERSKGSANPAPAETPERRGRLAQAAGLIAADHAQTWSDSDLRRAAAAEQTRIDAEPEPVQAPEPSGKHAQDPMFTAPPMPAGQISMEGIS